VLLAHADELHADINRTLDEVTHPTLAGQLPLARAAVAAWAAGYREAAQSLAVTVTEAVISRHYAKGMPYGEISERVKIDLDSPAGETSISETWFVVALAPIACSTRHGGQVAAHRRQDRCHATSPPTRPTSLTTRRTTC
jgi:hypothetical protein